MEMEATPCHLMEAASHVQGFQQPPFQKLLVRPLSLKQLIESKPASNSIS